MGGQGSLEIASVVSEVEGNGRMRWNGMGRGGFVSRLSGEQLPNTHPLQLLLLPRVFPTLFLPRSSFLYVHVCVRARVHMYIAGRVSACMGRCIPFYM